MKKISPRDPHWFGIKIKRNFRKPNILYQNFKRNGFKPEDKAAVDTQ